jgi:hypothetical protein
MGFGRGIAAVGLVGLLAAGCSSAADGHAASTKRAPKRAPTTTTTTLSAAQCLDLITRVQAGTAVVSQAGYEEGCGALPAGLVLGATTTTTTLPPTTTTTVVRRSYTEPATTTTTVHRNMAACAPNCVPRPPPTYGDPVVWPP